MTGSKAERVSGRQGSKAGKLESRYGWPNANAPLSIRLRRGRAIFAGYVTENGEVQRHRRLE
jgi:hypothetical protein